MLIYNFQKEFLGIDEKDLKILGFNTLDELRSEVTDFADLFVKTPGYVHNFKHVHWIDFINYADVSEESKVLINVNTKTFTATLSVSTLFLIDNPTAPAYMIQLNHLRPLSKSENANISSEILDRELPKVEPQKPKVFTAEKKESAPTVVDQYDETPPLEVPQPSFSEPKIEMPPLAEDTLSIDETPTVEQAAVIETVVPEKITPVEDSIDVNELSLDVFEEEKETSPTPPTVEKQENQDDSSWDNGYQYDPHIASKELGLPLDLIEEFIQDFIAQAKEFKSGIYNSIKEGDVDNVKILSHKLKGVAANLRIEDAHEVLSAVSATADMDVIHENLDTFYKIIAKLAGESTPETNAEPVTPNAETIEIPQVQENNEKEEEPLQLTIDEDEDDDFLTLDFKDEDEGEKVDMLTLDDEDVPAKIEMPELADDDFLEMETTNLTTETEPEIESEQQIEAATQDETPQEINFSITQAAKEIGIDENSYHELFNDYIVEGKSILKNIETAAANQDFKTIKNETLKFKGMSDNMRVNEFKDELETLMQTTEEDAITHATEKIDTILQKISKIGA